MKPTALLALTILLLTSACVRPVSTANPITGRNPFTPAAEAPACGVADLQSSSNAHQDAEAVILGVTLINQSASACSLQNPPQVGLLAAGQPLDVQLVQAGAESAGQTSLNVSSGESAVLILTWRNFCGQALTEGPGIRLALAEAESLIITADISAVPRCEAANEPSTLTVNPYSYPP